MCCAVLRSDDVLLPITFPGGTVPLKYFAETLRSWIWYTTNPNLYEIVVQLRRTASRQRRAALNVGIVQDAVFTSVVDCTDSIYMGSS